MENRYVDKKYIFKYPIQNIPKNMTISSQIKSSQLTSLIKNIQQKNSSKSVSIAIDLHLSGYIDTLIQKLINYYFNNINVANIVIINFLDQFLEYYYNKYHNLKKINPLIVVNDIRLRNFIIFYIHLAIHSNNKVIPKLIKLDYSHFDLSKCKQKMFSKNLKLISRFIENLNDKNIKNLIIPLSEIVSILQKINSNENISEADQKILYWISWLYEYEKSYNHGKYISIPSKHKLNIENKFKDDFIWIIWSMFFLFCNTNKKPILDKLFRLFKFKYTKGSKRTKSNILITALYIIVDTPSPIEFSNFIEDKLYCKCIKESIKSNELYYNFYENVR